MKKLISFIFLLFGTADFSVAQGPPLPPPPPHAHTSLDLVVSVLVLASIVYGSYRLRSSKPHKAA
ncbi:MAG: hypothetical protein K9J17_01985 [Flavobacteriales bacterium]|nr:hypothetical protein [Flavobacteriales bacterium]